MKTSTRGYRPSLMHVTSPWPTRRDFPLKVLWKASGSYTFFLFFCINRSKKLYHMQCSGSMTFWGGSGSGSSDPCFWLMDPDPAIFVIDLQDDSKKLIFNTIFSAYYFLQVHLHHFSRNQGFSYYFCMMTEGSGRPKNMWIRIRIRNTDHMQCCGSGFLCLSWSGSVLGSGSGSISKEIDKNLQRNLISTHKKGFCNYV